jgi:gentisate 1,2-dioxygenase
MEIGDVALTAGWCWHDGHEPAYCFDGLDVLLVRTLEDIFYEDNPVPFDPKPRPATTRLIASRAM